MLKGVKIYKLEFCEHCVIGKNTNIKFGTAQKRFLITFTRMFGDLFGGMYYFVSLIDNFLGIVGVHHETQRKSPKFICGVK